MHAEAFATDDEDDEDVDGGDGSGTRATLLPSFEKADNNMNRPANEGFHMNGAFSASYNFLLFEQCHVAMFDFIYIRTI